MSNDLTQLPPELQQAFLSFLREEDGSFQIADLPGFVRFIAEHAERYPFLLDAISLNKPAVIAEFQRTGAVPPGVKIIQKSAADGSNVTQLRVFHGPSESVSDGDE